MMKIAIYIRVSTARKVKAGKAIGKENPFLQNPEVQLDPLKKLADARGWEVVSVYQDRMTGSVQQEARPGYRQLWDDLRKGKVEGVLVWRFDRFSRSAAELLTSLNELRTLKIEFISYTENIDTGTAMGRAMFQMIAAFAEMERENTRERVLAGMEFAREKGTKSGNAIGRPKVIFARSKALEMAAEGKSTREIAKALGVSRATIGRVVAQKAMTSPAATGGQIEALPPA